jgi:lysyl-tRNA synthetase class 1
MSAGGSHDLAVQICQRVLDYPVPYALPYEFFLVGGKKMSSSKGLGSSAQEMLEILPPEVLRFLMVRTRLNSAIDFEPAGETIPRLFDDYQRCARAYYEGAANPLEEDLARIFELSAINQPVAPPTVRFATLCQWVQMPDMAAEIAAAGVETWVPYAQVWLARFASEEDRFTICEDLPAKVGGLLPVQKSFLSQLGRVLEDLPSNADPEIFQGQIYDLGKVAGLNGQQTFSAIYLSLLDKDHGPKAAWLLLSLERNFLVARFRAAGA